MSGHFIVFEGPEGAGKTTQMSRLADELKRLGHHVVVTREPGGTPVGDAIREILLGAGDYDMLPETEALLLSAARAQHVHDVIAPALDKGAIVLCDRYADSSLAYQGGGRGMNTEALRCLERIATDGLDADLRLLLDLPVELGLARRHHDTDNVNRIDRADVAFHERVREAYLALARGNPFDWTVIDASRLPDQVHADITRKVLETLSRSMSPTDIERQV